MSRCMIVGAGVVGTATGKGLAAHGHDVEFIDVVPATVERLRSDGYRANLSDQMSLKTVDFVFVSVTAQTNDDGIDLTHLIEATHRIGEALRHTDHQPVIVYRCTMEPGTMRGTLIPMLERVSGKQAGQHFGVVYNPEYLREISAEEDFLHPRIVTLAGISSHSPAAVMVADLLSDFGAPIHFLSLEAAEFQKYVNNVGNAVKISTYNLFRMVGRSAGLSDSEIDTAFELSAHSAEGLWNARYGTRNMGAYGGACLPKDTKAFRIFAESLGVDIRLLDIVQEINEEVER